MTDDERPDVRWAPIEPRQSTRGRVWLIVGLIVAALLIVAVLLFFLLPRGVGSTPDPTPTPTASPTETRGPGSPSPTPTEAVPTPTPTALDPAAQLVDDQLQSALDDLDVVEGAPADLAQSIVGQLLDGTQRMSDSLAGAGSDDAYDALDGYARALQGLQTTVSEGSDRSVDIAAAREAVEALRAALRR